MFKGVTDFLEQLASGFCIASTGRALAAMLMLKHGPEIDRLMRDNKEKHFLMQLSNQVVRECQFLFRDFYNDIKLIGTDLYQVESSRMVERNEQIVKIFEGLKRNNITRYKLPPGFLALLHPQRQSSNEGRPIKKPKKNPTTLNSSTTGKSC